MNKHPYLCHLLVLSSLIFIFVNLYNVSGWYVPIIRRYNCVYATLGTCFSVWITVWCAGWNVFHCLVYRVERVPLSGVQGGTCSTVWCTGWNVFHCLVCRVKRVLLSGVQGGTCSTFWCAGWNVFHCLVCRVERVPLSGVQDETCPCLQEHLRT